MSKESNLSLNNNNDDDDFFGIESSSMEHNETETKKHKLDIFSTLYAIDNNQLTYLDSLTEEERKGFVPVVVMRWASAIEDKRKSAINVMLINEFVNKHFWALYKHPELQFKLMAMVGIGKTQRHQWIAGKAEKANELLIQWMLSHHVLVSEKEIAMKIAKMTIEDIEKYIDAYAVSNDFKTELLTSYGKLTRQSDSISTKLAVKKTRKRKASATTTAKK